MIELAKDKSIVICKADKGNAVVIQDLSEYREKVSAFLKTDGTFDKLKDYETRKRETNLQNFMRKLRAEGKISNEI